ncbi:S41 family peptidase [Terasakiella sp. A23]|uniref:S41 family peptidase n=1 Tax=Terasakiella sp. FCG-A23 TaxID=3080561 RepID=UPI0029552E26|nr:S41 family peptidase [Terasakiella sp. A23]MDV7341666.1 S41 family peptidase [Terasakiella sp. A23]
MNRSLVGSFAALLILSACAGPQSPTYQARLDKVTEDMRVKMPRDEISSVLASGFYNVSERALTPVDVRALGLEGLRGLATIDPEIGVAEKDGVIEIRYGDDYVTAVVEPMAHDSESWSDVVYEVLQALWPYSEDLVATSSERVYEAVFDAALSNLDIFSRYAGQKEAEEHRDRREGFGGIDVSLRKSGDDFFIKRVGRDSPAFEGGVRKGDRIIRVDGQSVSQKRLHQVYDMMRGKIQTEMVLEVERVETGAVHKLFLWRELVIPQTVWASFDDGVLNLRISSFNERTVGSLSQEVQDIALMHGQRFRGLVLDLRGNPGGLLKKAVRVADLFLPGGRIISTQGRHPDSFEVYEADLIDVAQGRPMVVLLDGKSASASEIVAAALQDRGRAVVVGSSSYGKGTVQSVQRLPNDGEITVTWSRLIAPSGYAFHGLGVRPSVCTSGVKDNPDRGAALFEDDGRALMKNWRTVAIEDRSGRKSLRLTCPPDRRRKGIDKEIARNIILDPGLYKRFMGFTTIATVAQ